MVASRVAAAVIVLSLACCAEDVPAQLKSMQAQIEKLGMAIQQQSQTIAEQRRQIDGQKNELESMRQAAPASAPMIEDILRKYDILEEKLEDRTAQAIKIASRKKPGDSNIAIGGAIDTSFGYRTGNPAEYDRPRGNDFQLRGAELVFTADIDPFFKAYMVVNAADDASAGDEAALTVEEAAIQTTSLKYCMVKGGRFFVPF